MIQNLGSLIKEIKKHLPEYLQEHGINTNSKLFKCFVGNTRVVTSTGIKYIKDIKEGDIVYGVDGKRRKVLKTFKRVHRGFFTKIKTAAGNFECTADHKIYTYNLKHHKFELKKAEDLEIFDFLPIPIPKFPKSKHNFDWHQLVFLGLYLAEGSIDRYKNTAYAVRFSFNIKEKKYINFVLRVANKFPGTTFTNVYKDKKCHIASVYIKNCKLAQWLSTWGKKTSKQVPFKFLFNLSLKDRHLILLGWLLGDGDNSKSNKTRKGYTISPFIAHLAFETFAALEKYPICTQGTTPTSRHRIYNLLLSQRKRKAQNFRFYTYYKNKKYYIVPVLSVHKYYNEQIVYNLNVHSNKKKQNYLLLFGIPVKNCPNFKSHKNEDLKPSANFFPDNTSWHCFACEYASKLGDIFDAVHLLEGKDITGENFFEVVKYLCKKYRIPYSEKTSEEERFLQKINQYFELLTNKAHSTLKSLLPKLPKVKKLLEDKRWITEIDKFKLGYLNVPFILEGYDDVLAYLNLNPLNIVNRIIIPIIVNNKIVGITTRTIEDSSSKYKHFVAYSIKKILFNINNIDKSNPVYIVEGPSSCITLSHFKINNILATFGNYFHPNQLNVLIKNKIKNIIFLYDGDGGGAEGLRNSLINLSTNEIETKIGFLEDGLDPADYVIKHKNLKDIKIENLLNYLVKEYSANTQDKYIEKCLMKYINTIEDPVLKEKAINQISKQAKINKSTIGDLLNLYAQNLSGKIADLLKERDSLINTLTTYEKWTWSRGNLLGLKSFKSLDLRLDGVQDGMILVGGKPNIGKCVKGDTLIVTNEGILPISFFASPKQLPNTARPLKVQLPTPLLQGETSHFYYGRSKTIKIRLDNGVELEGTPNHPIAIKKLKSYKMVKLKELKKGDNVLIQVGTNTWGNSLQLPKKTQNIKLDRVVKYKPTKIPKYWTPELAYLVGYYLGDGLGTSNTFIIIMNSTYSSYILKIVKNLFGIEMNRKGKYTYVGGNFITNFMRALGISKQKHTNISIPLSILKAPKHIVASFIKGYFLADGYSNKQGEVSFTSASKQFLKELQTILFNFGIISTLKSYKRRATNAKNTKLKVYYTLYVNRRYTNLVKFYRDVLQCDKKVQTRTNTKIKNIIDYTAAFTKTHKYEHVIREPYYITSKIKKIERHNKISDVYDFTVPSTHLFLSNSIISHNTLYLNSLALKILQENENVYVLYFTIDDSMYTTISRFIANLSELPINVVSNPNFKINKANLPEAVKRDYILRRENALEFLKNKARNFNIKDGTEATTIEKIKSIIESIIPLTQGKKLVIFIDNLHNLRSERSSLSDRHLYSYISNQINNLATIYQCPIICSVHVTKDAIKNKQFDGSSIKETVELFYDAKLILFVDSDEDLESNRDDVELKIYVSKNKQSGFKGVLNFIAYKSISKCKEQENSESKLFS